MLLSHQIRLGGQRPQRSPVGFGSDRDHLAMGAMNLAAADRHPGREGAIELGDRLKGSAPQHMVADDADLAFHPALPGRPIRSQHIDGEAVMIGERRRLRVQRHRHPGRLAPEDV
jgi:hypothetical protein